MDLEYLGDSSCIDAAGYESGMLTIHFTDGSVYTYHGVDPYTWRALKTSVSKGFFFNKNIRNNYSFTNGPAPDVPATTKLYDMLETTLQNAEYFEG